MQQQITAAAAAQHQQQTPQHSSGQQNDVKVSELLPGYSPWMRNAGRKKSHPVWEFFKDLKDTSENAVRLIRAFLPSSDSSKF
ncbi:unnamed protein product [Nippostrongylus brasiliensis]|uniref:Mediator of RNA polymerase II transcription subunit 15-like n=1 Tax=Nippostrongylus brasiliensis TaxID=27835 RepID=A0A0N4YIT8_NIPBR|nr:unnamed protein product [Nippostrongylus brasiliensis]